MQSLVLIVQDKPYGNNNKAWDSLRIAGAAIASDMQVKIFLLDKGVKLGVKNHSVPDGHYDLEHLLTELIECDLQVTMCGKCMDDHDITEDGIIEGIKRGSMKSLADWLSTASQTITL